VVVTDRTPPAMLRIGTLSRRLGVSEHVLRAWERRYDLLRPSRTPGGFRLYSEADVQRVQRMQGYLAEGLSPAQAARAALDEDRTALTRVDTVDTGQVGQAGEAVGMLAATLDAFDEPGANAILDRLLSTLTVETVLRDVVLPYLHDLGERWEQGAATVAQEHFASNLLRGRLASLGRGWGQGQGPRALLACAPGELHDLALLAFGIVLNRSGWRIDYLGADTPLEELIRTARSTRADLVVLVAALPERFDAVSKELTVLARTAPLAIGGAGATRAVAEAVGAHLLTADPVTAAEEVASHTRREAEQ
jgi:MerR family transcriptional regulator, light-induced transcriptional regulator